MGNTCSPLTRPDGKAGDFSAAGTPQAGARRPTRPGASSPQRGRRPMNTHRAEKPVPKLLASRLLHRVTGRHTGHGRVCCAPLKSCPPTNTYRTARPSRLALLPRASLWKTFPEQGKQLLFPSLRYRALGSSLAAVCKVWSSDREHQRGTCRTLPPPRRHRPGDRRAASRVRCTKPASDPGAHASLTAPDLEAHARHPE